MIFLQPLALLGLAAAAIPALLHLLQRRQPPEMEFPPLRYLTEAERRSARRLRLRHLLLLALRTALIVLVVLAAARPLAPIGERGGAHPPTAVVVVLDNSPSSGVVTRGGGRLLERLREIAAGSLREAGAADRLWLLLADGVLRAGSSAELRAIVDSVAPGGRRLDLIAAVERAARVADAAPLASREVHVVSDFQRSALGDTLGRRASVPSGVRVLALSPRAVGPLGPNRGIVAARVEDRALRISVGGTRDAPPAPVTARLGNGRPVGRAMVAPGSEAVIALPEERPGWYWGEVELEPDELRADDRRPFVWRVAPPARAAAAPGAGPFVHTALDVLREAGRVRAGTDVVIGETAGAAAGVWVVLPPADAALVGQMNRALAARGSRWRFVPEGGASPGLLVAPELGVAEGVPVARRIRLERTGGPDTATGGVIATVNGEPWLVREGGVVLLGSRLDTAWTALPATPAFVPFLDALVNRVASPEGELAAAVTSVEGLPGVRFSTRGADTVGAVVSAPDPRESDLTAAPEDLIAEALGAEVLGANAFGRARFGGGRRADLTGPLLALALLMAAVELAVATRTR